MGEPDHEILLSNCTVFGLFGQRSHRYRAWHAGIQNLQGA